MKWLFLFLFTSLGLNASDLTVQFENIPSDRGEILYLLFSSENGFPDEVKKSFKEGKISALEGTKGKLIIKDLPPGDYALSVFHDENKNGKLDTNFLGIPQEGFAFSSNPKIYFGPPHFKKAKFSLLKDQTISIQFINF